MRLYLTLMILFGGPLAAVTSEVANSEVANSEVANPASSVDDSLSEILVGLTDIETEMTTNQERIVALQDRIAQLQSLGDNAEVEVRSLQTLVEAHAARVQELGERYAKVLSLAQKLKHDLEFSVGLNYLVGGVAAVAVLVAIGEGALLVSR